jgi:hypothetical protein
MRPGHAAAPGGQPGAGEDQAGTGSVPSLSRGSDNSEQVRPYQLLPPLSDAEYAALRDSIAAEGIRVPVQVDERGVILDGHHRAAIAAELGIDCPTVVVSNLDTEAAKRTVALSLNLSRRHLNREQTRQVIAASIEADPDLSDREHARRCGCSPTTVGSVRRELEVSDLDADQPDAPLSADQREEFERLTAEIDQYVADLQHWLNLCYVVLVRHGMPEPAAWHLADRVWSDFGEAMLAAYDEPAAARFEDGRRGLMELVRTTATAGGAR